MVAKSFLGSSFPFIPWSTSVRHPLQCAAHLASKSKACCQSLQQLKAWRDARPVEP